MLNLGLPKHLANGEVGSALWDQREHFLAYALSFAVIGRFWLVHHRFFSDVVAFDGRLISLNLLYLGWIVLIPFTSEVLGEYGGQTAAVILYAANLTGVVLIGMWMASDARRAGLTEVGAGKHSEQRWRSLYIAAIFLASIPVAIVAPNVAPYMWLALFLDPAGRYAERSASAPG